MGSVNKAILLGNLGKDVELTYTPGGKAVARFSIATSQSWTGKEGDRHEQTDWHKIVAWGKLAENCDHYLKKGRQVYVEGRLETRTFEDREKQKRTITEIVAQQVVFLGPRASDVTTSDATKERSESSPAEDEEIPF